MRTAEENHRLFKKAKHGFMRWYWRVGQVGSIISLVLMALTYTTVLSDKIQWRFDNPYVSYFLTLAILGGAILTAAYLYDVKGKLWVEQIEVVTERNPYMTYHMTAKEIVSNLTMWIPAYEKLGNVIGAKVMEDWTKKALEIDQKVKPRCDELIKTFNQEDFIREKYPWYRV